MSRNDPPEFLIQVEMERGGVRLQAKDKAVIQGTRRHLEAASAVAQEAADTIGATLQKIAPSKGTVEFGLTFEAEGGVPVLAKGKVGASITVTLEWEKP